MVPDVLDESDDSRRTSAQLTRTRPSGPPRADRGPGRENPRPESVVHLITAGRPADQAGTMLGPAYHRLTQLLTRLAELTAPPAGLCGLMVVLIVRRGRRASLPGCCPTSRICPPATVGGARLGPGSGPTHRSSASTVTGGSAGPRTPISTTAPIAADFDDTGVGHDGRPPALGAPAGRSVRRPDLHQPAVPVPDRSPARPRREPQRRLPAPLHAPGLGRRAGAAAVRRRRVDLPRLAERPRGRDRPGQPAGPGVRRHRPGHRRGRTSSWSGSTSGRPPATWRTRTSGGCRGSSATSPCWPGPRAPSTTSGCAPGTPTARDRSIRRSPPGRPRTRSPWHPRARRPPGLRQRRRGRARSPSGRSSRGVRSSRAATRPRSARPGETISLRLGFRTVEIRGDVLLVNGGQLTFRGMNRHETHPELGRVFDEAYARADLLLMKQHNVNAIRTSHYPPHPRVLELADELGFWVIDECDLETHGFWFIDWRGNPSDDPDWRAAYLDRIERTVERDKNHPASSSGRWATSRAPDAIWPPWPSGSATATRSDRCTTRVTTPARTPTCTRGCIPTWSSSTRSAATPARSATSAPRPRRSGSGASRSCSASTRTPWATGRAR